MVFKTAMLTSQSGVWRKFEVVVEKTTALQSFFLTQLNLQEYYSIMYIEVTGSQYISPPL